MGGDGDGAHRFTGGDAPRRRSATLKRARAMIDVHSHLLPGVDDGSRSFEQSVWRARAASPAPASRCVVLTPHLNDVTAPPMRRTSVTSSSSTERGQRAPSAPELRLGWGDHARRAALRPAGAAVSR